jgi:hypothetical protein
MNRMEGASPQLSVVLATDAYETIRPVISALRRQVRVEDIEPVIVLPASARDGVRFDELATFRHVQIVEVDAVGPLAPARAVGVRAATAPIVFIGETHTYPQSGWAGALLAQFQQPWAAVVPGIGNANPTGPASWGSYLFDYGRWGLDRPAGEMSDPLIYNTAYRRTALLELGDQLASALDPNTETLWPRLMALGHRAFFAPSARILHLNVASFRYVAREKFCVGVVLGRLRSRMWSWPRRGAYLLASPLIPVVLLFRVARGTRSVRPRKLPVGTVAAMVISAIAKTAGEVVGYLGIDLPSAETRLIHIELRKVEYAGRGPR